MSFRISHVEHTLITRRAIAAVAATAALLLLLLAVSPRPASAAQPASTDGIDGWVEQRMAAHGIPGAAVAVIRGGQVVHLAGYGTADESGRPVTPSTPFIIGSVSKPFTAVVVSQLVEEGLLSWDEPVWPHLAPLVEKAPPGFEEVTVEQLLTHTGGLGMAVGLAGAVPIHDGPRALERRVADLLAQPMSGTPGDRFEYSNAGAMLLAAVTEQVTGRPFAETLRTRVFEPLGMHGSFASAGDPRAGSLATGHHLWFGTWRPAHLPYDPAGVAMGYIGSTASDLTAFMRAHLSGHAAVPATAGDIADGMVVETGWDTPLDGGYGRGWFVDRLAGRDVVSHTGSLGHFTTHVLMVPGADDLGVAVLTNASAFVAAGHEGQYDIGLGLTRLLLGEDPQPTDPTALMTLGVPLGAWGVAALLLAFLFRYLVRMRTSCHLPLRVVGARAWARSLLPVAGALVLGVLAVRAPLGVARHFYPDAGWAMTVIAYVVLGWGAIGVVRMAATLAPRGTRPRAATA